MRPVRCDLGKEGSRRGGTWASKAPWWPGVSTAGGAGAGVGGAEGVAGGGAERHDPRGEPSASSCVSATPRTARVCRSPRSEKLTDNVHHLKE